MPTKVLPHIDNANGGTMSESEHQVQSSPSDHTKTEAMHPREGRVRKRLHKKPAGNDQKQHLNHVEDSSPSTNEAKVNATTSTIASRRRPSLRNKVPSGARPLVRSPSKYSAIDNSMPTKRSASSNIKPVPRSRQSSASNDTQFNYGRKASGLVQDSEQEKRVAPCLPEVNFDDLHTSITGDLNFYDLAASPSGFQVSTSGNSGNNLSKESVPDTNLFQSTKLPEPRISRNNSLVLRQGNTTRQRGSVSQTGEPIGPPSLPTTKQRRQSHFPAPPPSNSVGRAPRKSIGPGILTNGTSEYSFLKDALPRRTDRDHLVDKRTPRASDNHVPLRNSIAPTEDLNFLSGGRGNHRKSMQAPMKTTPDFLNAAPSTPDSAKWTGISIHNSRSPARDSHVGTPSSGKRSSMMPGHASGLGARTISPTDARRMKRLSMMPNPPPMPHTPPVSLPDASCGGHHSIADSPSLIPRKSITPTSNRTTPDVNRKSLGSAVSISSTTSLGSLRAPIGAARIQHNLSTSRLPTLKSRPEVSASGGEEGVPPVPAIPKAYESPKNEQDIPFFAPRKSSLPFDTVSNNSTSTAGYVSTPSITSSDKETKGDLEPKGRRGSTLNDDNQSDERASGAQNGRRTLQPIQLPPLNLLPLSTPTSEKIALLQEQNTGPGSGTVTPPPRRGPPKTPSTPMTASKANFFSRNHNKEDSVTASFQARSSSSHYAIRSDVAPFRVPSKSSNNHGLTEIRAPRKAVSPFLSSSLPKSNSEYTFLRSKPSGDRSTSTVGIDVKSSRLTGPRAQALTKASKGDYSKPSVTPSTDTETSSFGTALRRKLSLTRKKSNSKTDSEQPPQPPDHQTMPPPQLPASATWNGTWLPSSSPTSKPTYLHSRRKSSHPAALSKHQRTRSEIALAEDVGDKGTTTLETASSNIPSRARAESSSIASNPRAYAANGLSTVSRLQAIDTQLDRDDLLAEEEMKKLASKRRNTEIAAKELDELRRRARPIERVSAAQVLQRARLNVFERGEIVDYPDIWFFGHKSAQKINGDVGSDTMNYGYDDERGDYNIVLCDHLSYRYEVVDVLGKGSFGQVVRCIDYKTGGLVAIKIIRNKKRFHQQALVEVEILKKIREWDPHNKFSMVNFTHSFYFRNHLCISTELLGMNLYEFIKIHDFKGFSLKLIRRFTKQLLNSLVLLKSHKVIHCDLKPENILLTHPAHSEIKVIDFGSSCLENEKVYTYIQSRFYRSPEVILGMSYGMPIDMWSLGCILAELLTGYPIFPGENEQEQLACIMEVFGPPDKHLIEKSSRRKLFFDSLGKPRLTVSSKGKRRRPSSKTLQQALKCDDEPFLDFLSRCLRWDPDRRIKPDEAIYHEFITGVKPSATRSLRSLPQSLTGTSPIKRFNSFHTTSGISRPLPDPPATTFKSGTAVRNRDSLSDSPSKVAPKRHSTITTASSGLNGSAKKGVSVFGPGFPTTLSKPGTRTMGGRPDLASAAAAAATSRPR